MNRLPFLSLLLSASLMCPSGAFTLAPARSLTTPVARASGRDRARAPMSFGRKLSVAAATRSCRQSKVLTTCARVDNGLTIVDVSSEDQLFAIIEGRSDPSAAVAEEKEVSSHPMPHIEGGLTIQEYGEMLTSHEKAALVINQVYIQSLKRTGKRITVLEVYAPWCRKCLKMSREVFKACKKYKDEVAILRLDCSEHPELAKKLGAAKLPLFLVYEDGHIVDRYGA